MSAVKKIPPNCHYIEVRRESYGYSVAHSCNNRILYVATYQNVNEAVRMGKLLAEREQADNHEVILALDSRLS